MGIYSGKKLNDKEEKKIRQRIKFVEGSIKAYDVFMEPIDELEEEIIFLQELLDKK